MTKLLLLAAGLIGALICGCDGLGRGKEGPKASPSDTSYITIEEILSSPEEHVGRIACLQAVARSSRHGVILFSRTPAKYGVPAELYDSDVDAVGDKEFVGWIRSQGRNSELAIVAKGVVEKSVQYPSFPYQFRIFDILLVGHNDSRLTSSPPMKHEDRICR